MPQQIAMLDCRQGSDNDRDSTTPDHWHKAEADATVFGCNANKRKGINQKNENNDREGIAEGCSVVCGGLTSHKGHVYVVLDHTTCASWRGSR